MENIEEIDIIITLVSGTLITFLLSGVVIYSVIVYQRRILKQKDQIREIETKFQKDLLEASLAIGEKERQALGKNIHDEIGALVNFIKLNNNNAKANYKDQEATFEILDKNTQLLLEINANVKAISNDLITPTLQRFGLIKALDQLFNQLIDSGSAKIEINSGISEEARFDQKIEVQLYRVCKELITNILKHSEAKHVKFEMTNVDSKIYFKIVHDGKGINNDDIKELLNTSKGLGIKSIISRMQIINGTINYYNAPNSKPSIELSIPVNTISYDEN